MRRLPMARQASDTNPRRPEQCYSARIHHGSWPKCNPTRLASSSLRTDGARVARSGLSSERHVSHEPGSTMRRDASVNLRRLPESSQRLQARRHYTGQELTACSQHPGTHVGSSEKLNGRRTIPVSRGAVVPVTVTQPRATRRSSSAQD
jgi:hypothetical protein